MARALSDDLRKRIIASKKRGDTEDRIASEKEVSKSVVTKLWFQYKTTGSYSPRSGRGGRKPLLSQQQMEQVKQAIEDRCDITLQELIDTLSLPVCVSALSRTINSKRGIRHKKNVTSC